MKDIFVIEQLKDELVPKDFMKSYFTHILCEKGSGQFSIDDKKYNITKNDIAILLPNTEIQICRSSVQEVTSEIKDKVPYESMSAKTMIFPKIISPAKLARLSASAYAMLAWCPAAYRIAYRQGRDMQWTRKTGEGKRQNALQQFPLSRFTGEGAPKGRVRD